MLAFAYLSASCVAGVVVLLVLRILIYRVQLIFSRRKMASFKATWEPVLTGCIVEEESFPLEELPVLTKGERFMFLTLWNYYQEAFAGLASTRLNAMASRLNIAEYARCLVKKSALRQRLVATVFLGNISDRESWQILEEQLQDDNVLLSIQAARSLAQIDLDRALPTIFAELLGRDDWQGAQVAAVLRKEIRADVLTPHLSSFFQNCSDNEAAKLLPFMDYMYHEAHSQYLRFLISKSKSTHLISLLLQAVDSEENLELVRELVDHDQWYIRNQAVAALGRLGDRMDLPLLIKGLGDEQWWVRYRAAEGVVGILRDREEEIISIRDKHEDRYAKEMIDQVLAERRFESHGSV